MRVKQSLPRMHSLLLISAVALAACGDDKWKTMHDDELAAKSSDCMGIDDPGPAMIQVCKNVVRECERRRKEGIYAC